MRTSKASLRDLAVPGVRRGQIFFSAALLLASLHSAGQETAPATTPPAATFKVESHLIETTLSVRNQRGDLVTGLSQSAFTVTEDGVPQHVRYFAQERELPLSIGLIVDESGSQESFVKAHEQAVERFLSQVLEPKDQVFAVCFGNRLRLVSDWTDDPSALVAEIHRFDKGDRRFPEIGPREERELGTALFDAVYFPVMEKLDRVQGRRKVLLLFTDGEENSSEHDLLDAIQAAQDGNVLLYAIRTTAAAPQHLEARDRYGERVLQHLAAESGGRVYDAGASRLEDDFAEIALDLRSLYDVGYYSTHHARDGRFRKVTIEARQRDEELTVHARSGYIAR